jgi:hypothetical protein
MDRWKEPRSCVAATPPGRHFLTEIDDLLMHVGAPAHRQQSERFDGD